MKSTLPLFIVEPSGQGTRRRLSGALLGLSAQPNLQDLRSQLREMRERCLTEQDSLVAEFREEVSRHPGTECLSARDGTEAAEFIRRIARDSRNVVLNRSASVANELKPRLLELGFRVIEPYHSEPGSFDNRIGDYWDLPDLQAKGLMPSFELQKVNTDLGLEAGDEEARKDCVAVIGVSAACAQDGSVFFVQHSCNISRTLEQAGEVVLIVGLDKVVKTKEDVALQTRCMGLFGLEAMLLNLRRRQDGGTTIDSLPPAVKASGQRWHVILLDNGRSRILSSSLRELLLCIGCKACVVRCPINHSMAKDGAVWSPRDHLFMFLLGRNPLMDTCLHCEACRVECPLSIDLPKLMWMARADHAAKHGRSLRERMLGNPEIIAKTGALTAPISNAVVNLKPAKMLISASLGFDPARSLPRFHRETFTQWFADSKRKAKSKVAANQGKVAYFVGCFANYYQPDLAKAVVNVMKKNGIEVAVPAHECCGMPMLANKNMTGFRRNAERNIRSLASFITDGWEVVTSCPSCALMIRREYPNFCSRNEASLMSQHVYYVDEYLVRLGREGRLAKDMVSINQSVLCHIPCHLKVQDEGRSTLELLRTVPGLSVSAVNATCCGMGGYHGFKKAYSRLSVEIGEKLFRDIERAGADRVVTDCAACGLQISYGTGITAMHPVQLLERAYGLDRPGDSGGR
jgi:anaerobic glycerol-3-phosphate dehydrogenase C subunit